MFSLSVKLDWLCYIIGLRLDLRCRVICTLVSQCKLSCYLFHWALIQVEDALHDQICLSLLDQDLGFHALIEDLSWKLEQIVLYLLLLHKELFHLLLEHDLVVFTLVSLQELVQLIYLRVQTLLVNECADKLFVEFVCIIENQAGNSPWVIAQWSFDVFPPFSIQ